MGGQDGLDLLGPLADGLIPAEPALGAVARHGLNELVALSAPELAAISGPDDSIWFAGEVHHAEIVDALLTSVDGDVQVLAWRLMMRSRGRDPRRPGCRSCPPWCRCLIGSLVPCYRAAL